jgi:hypothetical protein
MKRFRLSTLMLLIVIAAMSTALVVQHDRAVRREVRLRAKIKGLEQTEISIRWSEMSERRLRRYQSSGEQGAEKRESVETTGVEKGKQ